MREDDEQNLPYKSVTVACSREDLGFEFLLSLTLPAGVSGGMITLGSNGAVFIRAMAH